MRPNRLADRVISAHLLQPTHPLTVNPGTSLTVIADNPAEALERVRAKLGPDAVVLSVRSLPRPGITKLWQRPRVEVRARGPAPSAPTGTLERILATIRRLNPQLPTTEDGKRKTQDLEPPSSLLGRRSSDHELRSFEDLVAFGLLPVHARALINNGAIGHEGLMRSWRSCPPPTAKVHVFVGAAGVGKTTVLCKWLAQVVLLGGQSALVWRLDGRSANTAESLAVYSEILSVPVARAWSPLPPEVDIGLVDLPGIDWRDAASLQELARQIDLLGPTEVHLVLNAAYESSLLLQQIDAFSALPLADLIITHLDEEPRWGKLWNLVLGSSHGLRFLSVGQNVPGTFQLAAPEHLL